MRKIDRYEKEILRILQEDSTLSLNALAARVNLSPTPCWRRIQRLKDEGIIGRQVTLLDPDSINVGVNVFVSIRVGQHNVSWLKDFTKAVSALPEVVEFYRMTGEVDLLMRVVVPDIKAYDAIYHELMSIARKLDTGPGIFDVNSSFALEQLKYTTSLPLGYI